MRARTEQVAGRALRAPGQLSGRQLACAGGAVCCGKEAGPWPHGPSRGTGAIGARAVIGTSARLRGVRGRTGRFAPWGGELTLALVRADASRPRRGFRWDLSGLAAGKKPACLGCNPRPCRRQEGSLARAATHRPVRPWELQCAAFSVMMVLRGKPRGSLPENGRRLAFNQRP